MSGWLPATLLSFGVIFLAELGDKSQLMALTFATRYRVLPVLVGITVATSVVHAVSVAIGYGLGSALPIEWVLLAAGLAFLGFAAWTVRGDELSPDESSRANRSVGSAVVAASVAFLLAELGDKTMLATITLASQHGWFGTWLGSTVGMVAADALAILVGRLLGKQLPERLVRFGAATLFLLFGCSLTVDAAAQFARVSPSVLLATVLNHHLAGWIALGIGLVGILGSWLVHARTRLSPHGQGPGPYPAPRTVRRISRVAGWLLALAWVLGLAAPLLVAADVLQPIPLLSNPGGVVVGATVMLLGVALLLAEQVELGAVRRARRKPGAGPRLHTGGLFSRIRNPGFLGMVVAMAGTMLMVPTLMAVMATVLIVVAVQIQVRAVREPDLAGLFGRDYAEYQERTGRFLPKIGTNR
ncbi:MAG TPA: TMEM165/GDT1 family protein [Pseudonocardia sp.]|jgi:putative Ca2+/H+ antiporter (TMEM165/GDT1 family)/protein-S-isoprenylcysteine O-methyltransferase Ste14